MEQNMLETSKTPKIEEVNMQDIIATMQKHIDKQFSQDSMPYTLCENTQQSIHKFSEDIKGANEFIGALQTANVACKKILKQIQNVSADSLFQDIQDIVENTAFMGVKLFDTQLNTTLNATSYTFCIDNPMPLLQQNKDSATQEAFIAYIEEKSQEITQLLLALSDALVESSTQPNTQSNGNYNFNEFNAKVFSQMLKG